MTKSIAAIILAAGGSTRFGQPKPLLMWNGRPLVVHIADMAWLAGLDPVIVVVGAEAERVIPVLQERPVQIVRNYHWEEGMSSSLNAGLSTLPPRAKAAIFLQVDQPLVTPRFLRALVTRQQATEAGIVVPVSQGGQRGTPVLFTREFFPELARLTGDVGGRVLFKTHADRMAYLPVADATLLADADTPEAYDHLQEIAGATVLQILGDVRAVLADMDGVLWRGDAALPGLHEFFAFLTEHQLPYMLITNNSSRTPQQYVDKLAGMGVHTTPDHILTSALATADYLVTGNPGGIVSTAGASVYAIGGPGVFEALRARGFHLSDGTTADYVVIGWDRDLTWEKLATATLLIRRGAALIGTNPDRTFPMERGLVPGNGAQLAALQTATDVAPVIVGKPAPILYQQALARIGAVPETTLMIGDRLDTDILGAARLGLPTALLLSGTTTAEELSNSPICPDIICQDLVQLVNLISKSFEIR
ncbi:MAG: HAD-IIA family hydrolase [Anaerolineae bacterium]|nr:HAD-IIA family hydrolase [Anaerolineae bacterium]